MNSSFAPINENQYDRNFGGTVKGVADPYISGYHFIHFTKIPDQTETYAKYADGGRASLSKDEIIKLFDASCLSVTPPGGTLNKAEFTGLGGTKFSVPTNVDYGNTLTIKFLEYSAVPILSAVSGWVRMIRDYRTGVSRLDANADAYTKSAYAGAVLYWTTKPDGVTVEQSAFYTGVFPTKDPLDLYTGDLTAVDKLEVDIEFNVDWIWHEDWVHSAAQSKSDSLHKTGKDYREGASGGGVDSALATT